MPEPDKPSTKRSLGAPEPVSRIAGMKVAGVSPALPPNPAPYLVDWLFEAGPSSAAGLSAGPIGWQELEAWARTTGRDLLPWEARILRKMSREFTSEAQAAKKRDAPAPWASRDVSIRDREAVSRKVGNAFKVLMQAKRGTRARESRNARD